MTTTSRTNEKHLAILSHAASHLQLRVLPLPADITNKGGVATRLLKSLLRNKFVTEVVARAGDREWSRAEDGTPLTLIVSPAGLAAIGVEVPAHRYEPYLPTTQATVAAEAADDPTELDPRNEATLSSKPQKAPFRARTKGAAIIDLLACAEGASLAELMAASGWQALSVRGFLSGTVRKKHGLALTSESGSDGLRRYRIAA